MTRLVTLSLATKATNQP